MDRELKPPYVPPKEKLISDTEIKKMEQMNKKVYNEIEVKKKYIERNINDNVKEEQKTNPKKYKKELASDPNWDKNF